MRPSAISARTAPGSTVWISPTWPRSTGAPSTVAWARVAVSRFASSPDIPTANGPCRLIRPTTSRFTWPVSTILTTSMVSGVVTRSPAANVLSMPELAEMLADLRAAAVHDHRAQPGVPQEHHVLREREAQRLVGHGVPAELDHDGLTVELLKPGQRLDQGRRLGQRAYVRFGARAAGPRAAGPRGTGRRGTGRRGGAGHCDRRRRRHVE